MKYFDLAADAGSKAQQTQLANLHLKKGVNWPCLAIILLATVAYLGVAILLSDKSIILQLLAGITLGTWLSFTLFCMMHEAAHGNLFAGYKSAGRHNDWVGHFLGIATLICYYQFKITHRDHHKHTNDEVEDPNYWAVSKKGWAIAPDIAFAFAKNRTELSKYSKRTGNTAVLRAYERHWMAALLSLIIATALFGMDTVFSFWILPAILSVAAIFLFFAYLPHGKSVGQDTMNEKIPVYPSIFDPIVDIISVGQKYHLLHHRFPRVPCHRLRALKNDLEISQIDETDATAAAHGAHHKTSPLKETVTS
ncbi:MAG: fatty acid desaturase [Pseudomonadota bacterium]